MIKKTKIFLVLIMVLVTSTFLAVLCGCNKTENQHPDEVTVTFKFVGAPDIVMTTKYGGSITPPELPEKIGNIGYWDTDNFNNITEDLTVNAVYETEWLKYTRLGDGMGYEVSYGDMDFETQELFIPAEHGGLPVIKVADNGFARTIWGSDKIRIVSVTLPEGLKIIGERAFEYNFPSLTSVSFPSTLTEIGAYAFCVDAYIKSIDLPEGLTSIGESAFSSCSRLETVVWPSSLQEIGPGAFASCKALQSIDLPEGLQSLGKQAFQSCKALQSIDLPEGLTVIPDKAFFKCSALSRVTIGKNVTEIGSHVFEYCENLTEVLFAEDSALTTIKRMAFDNTGLTQITLPASVTTLVSTFTSWRKEQTIYVKGRTERPKGWDPLWCGMATVVWDC